MSSVQRHTPAQAPVPAARRMTAFDVTLIVLVAAVAVAIAVGALA